MATVTARRLIAFNPTYGYPEELSDSDPVKLAMLTLTGINGAGINANGQTITGLPAPVAASDAATKGYTDGIAQGISAVASVRALAIGNIATLSGTVTIDGVSVPAGGRVLLVGQTNGAQNGVWIVQSGTWTRPTTSPDYLTGTSAAGRFCFVEGGTIYAKQGWVCTNQPGSDVVDTAALTFTQFSGLGEVTTSSGLTSTLNTISIALASPSGLQFTNSALDTLLQPSGSLTKDNTGLGIQLSGSTLSNTGSGIAVLGLPAKFTIAGTAVDANFTSANANTLVDGNTSYADALHTHKSVISATQVSQVHTNGSTALSLGDPVYWSSTANVLARGDASALGSSVIIGVAGGAIAASATGNIIKRGIIQGALTNATPGLPVFLAVGGGLTQTVPTAASAVIIQVGAAVNSVDLELSIAYVGRRSSSGA